jgi:hypothetical protein
MCCLRFSRDWIAERGDNLNISCLGSDDLLKVHLADMRDRDIDVILAYQILYEVI